RDPPFRRIDRRTRPVHRSPPLEHVGAQLVEDEWTLGGLEPRVIPPVVGVADLLAHARELVERLRPRRVRHPAEVLQPLAERRAVVVDHRTRPLARLWLERLRI